MKTQSDQTTPELPLDCAPVFDLDIERDCEWPMPAVKAWKPVEQESLWQVITAGLWV